MLDKIRKSVNKLLGKKELEKRGTIKTPAKVSDRVKNFNRLSQVKNATKKIPIGVKKFKDDVKTSIGPKNMRPRNIGTTDIWDQKRDKFHQSIKPKKSYATPKPAIDFTYRRKQSNE